MPERPFAISGASLCCRYAAELNPKHKDHFGTCFPSGLLPKGLLKKKSNLSGRLAAKKFTDS